MKIKKTPIALLLTGALGLLFFTACQKDVIGPAGPQGAPGPTYTGSITGFVSLYDQYGTKLSTNVSNIKVSIDNTTTTALTDNMGKYSFLNLPTGSYSITIIDSAYGTARVQNIGLLTGQNNHDIKLSAIPTFALGSVTAVDTISGGISYVKVRGTVTADAKGRELAVYFGTTASVSSAPANYSLLYSKAINSNLTSFSVLVPVSDLYGAGLTTGSTAYFAVYPAAVAYASSSYYEDLSTGKFIYNAVGTSPMGANVVIP